MKIAGLQTCNCDYGFMNREDNIDEYKQKIPGHILAGNLCSLSRSFSSPWHSPNKFGSAHLAYGKGSIISVPHAYFEHTQAAKYGANHIT